MKRLAEILGVPLEETWPESPAVRAGFWRHLLERSEVLHRSRVAPTLAEFGAFSLLEREAFAAAADRVRVRHVLDLAAALGGQAEEVAAELDGGQSMIERDLDEFAAQLSEAVS